MTFLKASKTNLVLDLNLKPGKDIVLLLFSICKCNRVINLFRPFYVNTTFPIKSAEEFIVSWYSQTSNPMIARHKKYEHYNAKFEVL